MTATWTNRTYCGQVTPAQLGQSIQLMGWVDTIRDHGQVIFVHLRDIKGVVQIVIDPTNVAAYQVGETLHAEYVVSVTGTVRERSDDTINPRLATGALEVMVTDLVVLSVAKTPPFAISEKDGDIATIDEDTRLKYRYLDLRRPSVQHNLVVRHHVLQAARQLLTECGFHEVDTPVLTKSTPEGARDYLVPSRVHAGAFYALPQSPQLFKQLLMVAGLDRYFQITKCFRDEDLRPNRQPEFTQIDLEASFIDESFIYQLTEQLIARLFAVVGVTVPTPFPRMTYATALDQYGNDHPDLRFGMTLVDVTQTVATVQYNIFKTIIAAGGKIKGFCVSGQSDRLSKNVLQEEFAKKIVPGLGARGMTWMRVESGRLVSNIVQFFSEAEQAALLAKMNAQDGDVLMFVADANAKLVDDVLGRFRLYVADYLGLIPHDQIAPVWVTDFPMFESVDGKPAAMHHPFTQPAAPLKATDNLYAATARAYDVVINGVEIGGGSIRIHDSVQQCEIFKILGLSDQDIQDKFGFFVDAFQYGAPPHGGLAIGLDRLVAMILGTESIRDVIAFPKNRMAVCPMTHAPDSVLSDQLQDLHIRVVPTPGAPTGSQG